MSLAALVCFVSLYINQSQDWDVECVTERNKLCCFLASISGQDCIILSCLLAILIVAYRTVCYTSNGVAVQTDETSYHRWCKCGFYFHKEVAIRDSG